MSTLYRITTRPDRIQWKKFVEKHPLGNIFQLPCMYDLHLSVPGYAPGVIGLIGEDEEIAGLLSYNVIMEPGWKKNISGRSIITGGPLVLNNDNKLSSPLIKVYNEHNNTRVIYTQVRNLHTGNDLDPSFDKNGYKYIDHLNIHIDLTKDIETLRKELHPKRWSNIRRMSKKEIVIRELNVSDIHAVYTIITKTYNRINIPRPPAALLLNAFTCLKEHLVMFGAYHKNVLTGARVYLLYKGIIYDWYAASDLSFSHLHPNDLLPWHAMKWAKERGYTMYDFAGAGQKGKPYGVRDYKLRFGGTLIETGRWQCNHKPFLYEAGKSALKILKHLNIHV